MRVLGAVLAVLAVLVLAGIGVGVWAVADKMDEANQTAEVANCLAEAEASTPVLVRGAKAQPLDIGPVDRVTGLDERLSAISAC